MLKQITIKAEEPGPMVLISAGVHGDEYEPIVAAMELAEELPALLRAGTVRIVPVVNPSAYAVVSRYGEDGQDLARICPGNEAGSISEQCAFEISTCIRQADYYVDMHTGGFLYEIFPLAGYMLHADAEILEQQRQMALAFNMSVIWGTDHSPEGRTLSVARDAMVPAIYLEYGGGTGFKTEVVKAYKKGFLNLLRQLKMIEGEVEAVKENFWLEDHRKGSGYLQGKMPSPADGVLISRFKLGELVSEGDLWAEIIDPLTGEKQAVFADQPGLAFLERVGVKVKKGDALGGILPIEKPGKMLIYE